MGVVSDAGTAAGDEGRKGAGGKAGTGDETGAAGKAGAGAATPLKGVAGLSRRCEGTPVVFQVIEA